MNGHTIIRGIDEPADVIGTFYVPRLVLLQDAVSQTFVDKTGTGTWIRYATPHAAKARLVMLRRTPMKR